MFSVASTFARFDVMGSATERGTDGIAASCSTNSQPSAAAARELEICQVPLQELHVRDVVQVAALPGDERIGHAHAVTAADEFLGEMRPDESGAASNEVMSHSFDLSNIRARARRAIHPPTGAASCPWEKG